MALDINTVTDTFATLAMKPQPDEELVSDWAQKMAANMGALARETVPLLSGIHWQVPSADTDVSDTLYFQWVRPAATGTASIAWRSQMKNALGDSYGTCTVYIDGTNLGSTLHTTNNTQNKTVTWGCGHIVDGALTYGTAVIDCDRTSVDALDLYLHSLIAWSY